MSTQLSPRAYVGAGCTRPPGRMVLIGSGITEYRALKSGEVELHDYDLIMRIWDVWGWPYEPHS